MRAPESFSLESGNHSSQPAYGNSSWRRGGTTEGARRMQALVSDLLQYTTLAGSSVAAEAVDTAESVGLAIKNLSAAIEEAGALIEIRELPVVMAHPSRMTQLFQNLLSNALKYRRPDGAQD